eukprot:GILK01012055.1.p1 GENE.GILK01012055.1~~GILK01012055.1.p1  ORF type:complete len:266 (-),score=23.88 GILK01012055.1:170-943(-)
MATRTTRVLSEKILLIFDLNGTLLERLAGKAANPKPAHKLINKRKVWLRPGLNALWNFVFEEDQARGQFDVAVWSSAMTQNTQPMIDFVFGVHREHLLFDYHREHTVPDRSRHAKTYATLKDLQSVWAKYPQYGPTNTVLIDDSPSKAAKQPNNHILVPEFAYESLQEAFESDPTLENLTMYLSQLRHHFDSSADRDVRSFISQSPFYRPVSSDSAVSSIISTATHTRLDPTDAIVEQISKLTVSGSTSSRAQLSTQ